MTGVAEVPIRVIPTSVDSRDAGTLASEMADQVAASLAQAVRESGGELTVQEATQLAATFTADLLEAHATQEISHGRPAPSEEIVQSLRSAVLSKVLGLGGLQALMDDPEIETINANGHDQVFAIRADGTTSRQAPIAASDDAMVELIRRLATSGGEERRFDRGVARLNAELPEYPSPNLKVCERKDEPLLGPSTRDVPKGACFGGHNPSECGRCCRVRRTCFAIFQ